MEPIASSSAIDFPQEFVKFLNEAHSPYHTVHVMKRQLLENGFKELQESKTWARSLHADGKYFVTRNNSSIIAFSVGGKFSPGNPIAIIGGHTDSPTLRVKPISKRTNEKYSQVGVECYGGGIWHSWFDSDLSVAGRVFVKTADGGSEAKLVDLKRPLLKIPTLAIHLDREVNQKFEFNKETQLLPVSGMADLDLSDKKKAVDDEPFSSLKSIVQRHNEDFLDLIAQKLDLKSVSEIEDFELILYDFAASTLGGVRDEFVFSGRLDNLTSCFTGLHGLLLSSDESLAAETGIRLLACFDHEEVGSSSAQGADSNFLPNIIERLSSAVSYTTTDDKLKGKNFLLETYAKSFFLSSDVAHAVHPNYAGKHESQHKPVIGAGPVIKINANQRYMTNSPGLVLLKKVADSANVPLQLFVAANNSPCGSTIGPILASKTGIRTLDIGNPILSMHSIRETGGSADLKYQIDLFKEFLKQYSVLSEKINV